MEELIKILFSINAFFAIAGWLAFNVILFSLEKDDFDDKGEEFSFTHYRKCHYDNWLASLVFIPILLYIGYKNLNIGLISPDNPKWSDLYYLGTGFFVELIKVVYKKWKAAQKA